MDSLSEDWGLDLHDSCGLVSFSSFSLDLYAGVKN